MQRAFRRIRTRRVRPRLACEERPGLDPVVVPRWLVRVQDVDGVPTVAWVCLRCRDAHVREADWFELVELAWCRVDGAELAASQAERAEQVMRELWLARNPEHLVGAGAGRLPVTES